MRTHWVCQSSLKSGSGWQDTDGQRRETNPQWLVGRWGLWVSQWRLVRTSGWGQRWVVLLGIIGWYHFARPLCAQPQSLQGSWQFGQHSEQIWSKSELVCSQIWRKSELVCSHMEHEIPFRQRKLYKDGQTEQEGGESEDQKIDLVLKELGRYGIQIAALQETKWFGSAMYHVGYCVLTAGRPTPETDQHVQRGEGVS